MDRLENYSNYTLFCKMECECKLRTWKTIKNEYTLINDYYLICNNSFYLHSKNGISLYKLNKLNLFIKYEILST